MIGHVQRHCCSGSSDGSLASYNILNIIYTLRNPVSPRTVIITHRNFAFFVYLKYEFLHIYSTGNHREPRHPNLDHSASRFQEFRSREKSVRRLRNVAASSLTYNIDADSQEVRVRCAIHKYRVGKETECGEFNIQHSKEEYQSRCKRRGSRTWSQEIHVAL